MGVYIVYVSVYMHNIFFVKRSTDK
jgi:hypothetical protein